MGKGSKLTVIECVLRALVFLGQMKLQSVEKVSYGQRKELVKGFERGKVRKKEAEILEAKRVEGVKDQER